MTSRKKAIDDASEEGAFSFYAGLTVEQLRTEISAADFRLVQRMLGSERRRPGEWRASFLTSLHREIFGAHFEGQAGVFRVVEANYGIRAAVRPETILPLFEQLILTSQDGLRVALKYSATSEKFFEHVFFPLRAHTRK